MTTAERTYSTTSSSDSMAELCESSSFSSRPTTDDGTECAELGELRSLSSFSSASDMSPNCGTPCDITYGRSNSNADRAEAVSQPAADQSAPGTGEPQRRRKRPMTKISFPTPKTAPRDCYVNENGDLVLLQQNYASIVCGCDGIHHDFAIQPFPELQGPFTIESFVDYKPGRCLGQGSAGSVKAVVHSHSQKKFAEKNIQMSNAEDVKKIVSELMFVRDNANLYSDYLVKYYTAFFVKGEVRIIMELMEIGSLKKFTAGLPLEVVRAVLYQVLSGLKCLHSSKGEMKGSRVHRDLKPSNILINKKGQAKIGDFGCQTTLEHTFAATTSFTGTQVYMSPERLLGKSYSTPADIWSIGVVALECVLGKVPYTTSFGELILRLVNDDAFDPQIPDSVDPDLKDLILQCLRKEPSQRPTARAMLETHPFFAPIRSHAAAGEGLELKVVREWVENLLRNLSSKHKSTRPKTDTAARRPAA